MRNWCHRMVKLPWPKITLLETGEDMIWTYISSVQFSSVAHSCLTPCHPMNRSTPGLPVHHQLPGFTQTHVHQVRDAIQPSHPLSSPSPPALNPSHIRVFSNESTLHVRWPKDWSFSFSISPSNEYPGLIFRMDWLDLVAVEGTLKSFLQHHSSKASIISHQPVISCFFFFFFFFFNGVEHGTKRGQFLALEAFEQLLVITSCSESSRICEKRLLKLLQWKSCWGC